MLRGSQGAIGCPCSLRELRALFFQRARAEVHALLSTQRLRKGIATPHPTNLRKVFKGNRYKRGNTDTRGRKRMHTRANVLKMNATRKGSIQKTKDERAIR